MNAMKLRSVMYYIYILGTIFSFASVLTSAQGTGTGALSSSICNVVAAVRGVISVIAVILFVLGGTLYAVAHMLPAAGNIRGNLQGWSLGMIMGSIVGLVLVILAPNLIGLVISSAGSSGSGISSYTC